MKKNAIALAVGALAIAPAAHAQIVFGNDTVGTVQIYGKLYPQLMWGESRNATATGTSVSTLASPSGVCGTSGSTGGCSGASNGSRFAVDSQNSYLGFRGERKLGSTGLKGIWQIEQAIEIDTGNEDATFSNRNSFLGLNGGFGTVKLGHMDTIYKEYGQQTDMLGLTSGNFVSPSNVLSNIGVGSNSTARFHERATNTIQYQTPEFSGIQAGVQYAPDEARNDVGNTLNKQLWSFGVKWEQGPMYLSLQHEIHKDFFGGSNNVSSTLSNAGTAGAHSRDTAWRVSGAYKLGNQKIGADISRLKWSESGNIGAAPKFDHYQKVTWGVSLESQWGGPLRTAVEWVHSAKGSCAITGGGDCSTDGLEGDLLAGGVAYDLDKQTFLYVLVGDLRNGKSARFDNWAASSVTRGSDIYQAAVGMSYKF